MANRGPVDHASSADIESAMDAIVLRRLAAASPALAGLMLLLALTKGLVEAVPDESFDLPVIPLLVTADLVAAVAFLGIFFAVRQGLVRPDWGNPLAALMGTLLVADVGVHLALLSQPPEAEAVNFVVLIMAASVFLSRVKWFVGWVAVTLATWGFGTMVFPAEGALSYVQLLTQMLTATVVAVIVFIVQTHMSRDLELLRLSTAARAQDLERLSADLGRANEELDAFAYTASHDLKAPLRAIDVYAEALDEDAGGRLAPSEREHISRIRREAKRLGDLVDGALRLSRITRGELRMADVDLSALFRATGARLGRAGAGEPVDFQVEDGLKAWGDPELLQALVENLLGNAWKYTREAPHPTVRVGSEETPEGHAFFVRDNGVGFDMARAEKLFRPFQRLESGQRFEGSGIGLATVARIVDRHGGRIWAKGSPDAGATFWFTLSAPERAEPATVT